MTIERLMSSPPITTEAVDPTRRRFLSQAAVVAAGGAALATALTLPGSSAGAGQVSDAVSKAVAPPLRRPVLTMDGSGASDELRSAFRTLDDAHEVLKTTWAEYRRVVDLTRDWEREHPSGGGSTRAFRKWDRRRSKYFDEINYNAVCRAYHEAAEDFKDAQLAAADVKVRDLDELALKACAVYAYEDMREGHLRRITPVISVSVAVDLARMSLPEAG